jgi:hypothetical protein
VAVSVGIGIKVGVKVGLPGSNVSTWSGVLVIVGKVSDMKEMEVETGDKARRTPPSVSARTMLPSTSPLATRAVTSPRKTPPALWSKIFILYRSN